ncbi:MAG: AIR synthase-related protein, partial [Candidatus Limnocylindrales bacterium]
RWPMPSVMRLFGALGGLEGPELRATFNGGLGMVAVVPPEAASVALEALAAEGLSAVVAGDVVPAADVGGVRYLEVGLAG